MLIVQLYPPTGVDDGAGEADVAANWSLEGLGSGQDPHLALLSSDTSHCNSYNVNCQFYVYLNEFLQVDLDYEVHVHETQGVH